jgi:hypothetical protein
VSHQPERKEKDCLNCGNEIQGRFCHVCGQENIVPHQNFWSLTRHFVYDIFHFDGKFFDTLRLLLFRPGYVAKEYVNGKRVRFLDPIRMYLFTSAIFFLVFFSLEALNFDVRTDYYWQLSRAERMEMAMILAAKLKKDSADSIAKNRLVMLLDSTKKIELEIFEGKDSSSLVHFRGKRYNMNVSEDTIIIPQTASKNWLSRTLAKRASAFEARHRYDPMQGANALINDFLHRLPYLLFISLPIFAAILKLLYTRRKRFFYSDHAVFTLYHYILSFILLLFLISFEALHDWINWSVFQWTAAILAIALPIHLFIAMKRFYGQGFMKTLFKFLLLNLLAFVVLLLLFLVFLLLSLVQT